MTQETRFGDGADVGDVLSSSWGYDQTNISFYRVERRTEKSVWLVEVESRLTDGEEGFMTGHFTAGSDIVPRWRNGSSADKDYSPFRKSLKVSTYGSEPEVFVRMSSYEYARPWNGEKAWGSWYA